MDPVTAYKNLTDAIELATGLSRPTLHMHAGMTIYVATQLLLGERRGSVVALSMVLIAELGNELMNRLYWGSWRWPDTLADVVTTLFWPALCVAVSAIGRRRWRRAERRAMTGTAPLWKAPALTLPAQARAAKHCDLPGNYRLFAMR